MKKKIIFLLCIILLIPFVYSHETEDTHEEVVLPANLQKVADYNNQQADFYLKNLSFIIAFLAGMVGILTPCSLVILPAFFAYTFKEKKKLTKMTLAFFLGFAPVFISFGLLAAFLGNSIAGLQQNNSLIVTIAGVFIILLGIMTLYGRGFSGLNIQKKTGNTFFGVILFGILFGIGFTACMGPILVGILLIASVFQSYLYAGFLMLFYSFGLFIPLFIASFFFDKYNLAESIKNINKKVGFSITNLIAGLLLISFGLVFIIYSGTFIVNNLGYGNVTMFIYSIQTKLVSLRFINIIGVTFLIGFLILLWRFLKNRNGK